MSDALDLFEVQAVRKILLDAPTSRPALGYPNIGRVFAEVITQSRPNFAIGIFGGWGSGKTTLMTAIKAALPENGLVSVDFNAWRYEREPLLLIPLLDTIRGTLVSRATADVRSSEQIQPIAKRIGRVVRALATGLSGTVGLPGLATVTYDAGATLEALDALSSSEGQEKPESLYVGAFRELQSAFSELATAGITRIIVFVDDLDRCLPSNALDVLESMKLFFDLPGFIFVVGLDEDVVERAVSAKFVTQVSHPWQAEEADTAIASESTGEQLSRDYIKKIFQVPYSLPVILPQQLDELLTAMYHQADLQNPQIEELDSRVRPYLRYVAVGRRVNPRDVKRFINSYTLQTLVRPELDPDTILALQTFAFRHDWESVYDAILADSELFLRALNSYRNGNQAAFEELLPHLETLTPSLANYLRSPLAAPLTQQQSLDSYLSSLRSAHSSKPWVFDVYGPLGQLRIAIKTALEQETDSTIQTVISKAENLRESLMQLQRDSRSSENFFDIVNPRRIDSLISDLSAALKENGSAPAARPVLFKLRDQIERAHEELQMLRDSSYL
jgi:hypothetical protein